MVQDGLAGRQEGLGFYGKKDKTHGVGAAFAAVRQVDVVKIPADDIAQVAHQLITMAGTLHFEGAGIEPGIERIADDDLVHGIRAWVLEADQIRYGGSVFNFGRRENGITQNLLVVLRNDEYGR